KQLLILSSVILFLLVLGFGMLKAVRWSRKRNTEQGLNEGVSQEEILKNILSGNNSKENIKNYYASSLSKTGSFFGKFLAIGVIIFVTAFLLFISYAAIWRD
ncbi:MAG: hypothetical protein P8Y24_04170, partial [Gammaproteobacteria bacterium]